MMVPDEQIRDIKTGLMIVGGKIGFQR